MHWQKPEPGPPPPPLQGHWSIHLTLYQLLHKETTLPLRIGTEQEQDSKSETTMKVLMLNGSGDDQAPKDQEGDTLEVLLDHGARVSDTKDREDNHWDERRGG